MLENLLKADVTKEIFTKIQNRTEALCSLEQVIITIAANACENKLKSNKFIFLETAKAIKSFSKL